MARRIKRRHEPFASQAALESLLRFGPELSGLIALQRQAESNYRTGLAQARGTAESIEGAVSRARPQVEQAYGTALQQQAATSAALGNDVAELGNVADSIKAAVALEQGMGSRGIAQAKAATVSDLSSRAVQAREGAAFAANRARSQFVQDLTEVLRRRQDVAREQGAFQALTARQLRQTAQEQAQRFQIEGMRLTQQERNSLRSAGLDPDTGSAIQNGPLDPNSPLNRQRARGSGGDAAGRDRASRAQHANYASEIDQIRSWAKKYRGRLSRQQIVAKLRQGRPQQTIKVDPDTGRELAQPVVLPAIPAFEADLRMTAALDMVLDGHLSRETQRKLKRLGFSVRDLGLKPWQRPKPSPAPTKTPTQNMPWYGGT